MICSWCLLWTQYRYFGSDTGTASHTKVEVRLDAFKQAEHNTKGRPVVDVYERAANTTHGRCISQHGTSYEQANLYYEANIAANSAS